MKRLLPRSLFGQTLLVLLAGLVVSHVIGSWLYTADREQAVRAVGGFAAAQRIANVTRLIDEAPEEWRGRIVAALSDDEFRVSLSQQPPPLIDNSRDDDAVSRAIREFLIAQVPNAGTRVPRIAVSEATEPQFGGFHPMMGRGHGMGPGRIMRLGAFRDLQVAMPLQDGRWLSFATGLPETGPAFTSRFVVSMLTMAIIIVGLSIWIVWRVTAPLSSLAMAAERFGRDVTAPPIPETGTIETRQASRAFNTMQVRLRTLIDTRTRLLAAVSHDLRTPLTLLRLRAENIEAGAERDRMLATIAEMDDMIEATLRFARDEATAEAARPTDIASLLQSITDDMADAGLPVTMQTATPVVANCRPAALKRALTNLFDNALKYGRSARAAIRSTPDGVEVTIDDEGPGIPEQEIQKVFEPFYRLEQSRSRQTGGIGLGLAIALSAVQAQGGTLTLANRPEGGLRATVVLPR